MDIKEQIEQSLIDLFDAWNDEINENKYIPSPHTPAFVLSFTFMQED